MKSTLCLALVLAMFATSTQASLVAYWKLNDAVGSMTAADSSGNGYTAQVAGITDFTGSSFYLNRTGDGQNFLWAEQVPALGNVAFTWAMWTRATSIDDNKNGTIMTRCVNSANLWTDASRCLAARSFDTAFYGNNTERAYTDQLIWDNTWHYVAVTYDGASTVSLYLDGVKQIDGIMALNAKPDTIANQFIMGIGGNGWFHGELKEVRVYNESLTGAQIASLMVPEPVTMSLLGLGMLFGLRRKN